MSESKRSVLCIWCGECIAQYDGAPLEPSNDELGRIRDACREHDIQCEKSPLSASIWALTQIRLICADSNRQDARTTDGLTSGEQAWIWALAEFSRNMSDYRHYRRLRNLYLDHELEILERHANGWTGKRILDAIEKKR